MLIYCSNVVKYLESSSFLRWLLIQNEQFADRLFEQFRTGDAVKMFYYDDNVVLKYSGTILGIEGKLRQCTQFIIFQDMDLIREWCYMIQQHKLR